MLHVALAYKYWSGDGALAETKQGFSLIHDPARVERRGSATFIYNVPSIVLMHSFVIDVAGGVSGSCSKYWISCNESLQMATRPHF